jgi:hypothetical protein
MYPVVDVESLVSETEMVFAAINILKNAGGRKQHPLAAETVLKHNPTTLKLVLAIGLTLEKKDFDGMAKRLFVSVQDELAVALWHAPTLQMAVHSVLTVCTSTIS